MSEKLDKLDAQILSALDLNCRQSTVQLAKKVRSSREVVTYRLKRLQERGILTGFITAINPHAMGRQLYRAYIQVENKPERRNDFLQHLLHDDRVYWLGEFDGAWDYIMVIHAKDAVDFYDWKNGLLAEFNDLILKNEMGAIVDVQQYPITFLTEEKSTKRLPFVTWGGTLSSATLDELDYQLLTILSNDARIPVVHLAKKVNSSVDVVMRRMKAMEKAGVIIQYRIALDFSKLGLEFYKALVRLRRMDASTHTRLTEYLSQHPQCLYYIRTITPWEIEPEFVVSDYHAFTTIVNELRKEFVDSVRSVETVIIKKEWWLPGYKGLLESVVHH